MSAKRYILPSKIPVYLRRLKSQYKRDGRTILEDVVSGSYFRVSDDPIVEGYGVEIYEHEVNGFVPFDLLTRIDIAEQKQLEEELCRDFNTLCRAIPDERVSTINLLDEAEDTDASRDARYRLHQRANGGRIPTLWKGNGLRLFVSHRDRKKVLAHEIGDALEEYGIVSFVAHDNIAPMSEWRNEIIKALESAEAMLVLLTKDFAQSDWTNQEIGFALCREIPIVSVSVDGSVPPGFLGDRQAARFDRVSNELVKELYDLITNAVGAEDRMRESLVRAFVESNDFRDTRDRFDRLKLVARELTDEEERVLVDGYNQNSQLNQSIYLGNKYRRFESLLRELTGKQYIVRSRRVSLQEDAETFNDVPF